MYSTLNDYVQISEQLKSYIKEENELELEKSYAYCLNVMKDNSKSFYFAAQSLPTEQRKGVGALYAFCRLVDDFVDESGKQKLEINMVLDELKITIKNLATGHTSNNAILKAFGHTIQKYQIPLVYVNDLIEGVRMDLQKSEYFTNYELDLYCYRVASTVGLMMVHIFMDNPSPSVLARASDLGVAMQLTNILRDIKEDFERGRVYLPLETRQLYRVSIEDIEHGEMTPNFQKLIEYEIARTKGIYKIAELGIRELPKEVQFTILLSSRVYGDILNQIKRDKYKLLSKRAVVSKKRKLMIALILKIKNYSFHKTKQNNFKFHELNNSEQGTEIF